MKNMLKKVKVFIKQLIPTLCTSEYVKGEVCMAYVYTMWLGKIYDYKAYDVGVCG